MWRWRTLVPMADGVYNIVGCEVLRPLGLHFEPEDTDCAFLRNVSKLPSNYMASHTRWQYSSAGNINYKTTARAYRSRVLCVQLSAWTGSGLTPSCTWPCEPSSNCTQTSPPQVTSAEQHSQFFFQMGRGPQCSLRPAVGLQIWNFSTRLQTPTRHHEGPGFTVWCLIYYRT